MKDETYSFISDVKEKGTTARSAKSRCTHTKGGKVRFPSDNLSKKELQKMNGECKSYSLNSPMQKEEFEKMPDDLKIIYIKAVRNKYGIPDNHLGKAMGYPQQTFSCVIKRLGLAIGRNINHHKKWDKEGFYAWWNGVDKLPTPVNEETETVAEDDLPFDIVPIEEPEVHAELDSNRTEKIMTGIHPSSGELEARLEKANTENEWLRKECESQNMKVRILEAQMEVVRLIFGRKEE